MNNRLTAAILVALLLLAVGGVVFPLGTEDRPPIRVKNSDLLIEIANKAKPWKKDLLGGEWKPKHPKGHDVQEFVVSVVKGNSSCTDKMSGATVAVKYGSDGKELLEFTIRENKGDITEPQNLGKKEPKLASSQELSAKDDSTLSPGDFAISEVSAGGKACKFSGGEVDILICLNGAGRC